MQCVSAVLPGLEFILKLYSSFITLMLGLIHLPYGDYDLHKPVYNLVLRFYSFVFQGKYSTT